MKLIYRKCESKKGKSFDALLLDLDYTVKYLSVDRYLCAEALCLPVSELAAFETGHEITIMQKK